MDKFTSGNIGEVLEEVNKGGGGGSHAEIEQLEQDVEKLFNEKSDIYFTNEKIIGEWVDGSPIYQIVKEYTHDGQSGVKTVATLENDCEIIDFDVIIKYANGQLFKNTFIYPSQANNSVCTYCGDSRTINVAFSDIQKGAISVISIIKYKKVV